MAKLFECCHKCTPPKRQVGCHGTCPEYLADRAKLDKLNAEEQKEKNADGYVIGLVSKTQDMVAKHQQRSRGRFRPDKN